MKLEFNTISTEPREYTVEDFSWLPDEEGVKVSTPFTHLTIFRKDDVKVIINGKLGFEAGLHCDRCGGSFKREIESEFTYLVKNEEDISFLENEKELTEEEIDTVYLQQSTIDIYDMLREQFYLSIPESRLCRENCKGLCHNCGAILDSGACNCANMSRADVTIQLHFLIYQHFHGRRHNFM